MHSNTHEIFILAEYVSFNLIKHLVLYNSKILKIQRKRNKLSNTMRKLSEKFRVQGTQKWPNHFNTSISLGDGKGKGRLFLKKRDILSWILF